jgi:uncharacterized protein YciI
MRYFVLEGTHLIPFEQIPSELKDAHQDFLKKGMDAGTFLFSGPKIPATGGFLVARAESLEALHDHLAGEPFTSNGVMTFSSATEFFPRQNAAALNDWFGKQ